MISAAKDSGSLGAGPVLVEQGIDVVDAVARLDEGEAHACFGDRRPVDLALIVGDVDPTGVAEFACGHRCHLTRRRRGDRERR